MLTIGKKVAAATAEVDEDGKEKSPSRFGSSMVLGMMVATVVSDENEEGNEKSPTRFG